MTCLSVLYVLSCQFCESCLSRSVSSSTSFEQVGERIAGVGGEGREAAPESDPSVFGTCMFPKRTRSLPHSLFDCGDVVGL